MYCTCGSAGEQTDVKFPGNIILSAGDGDGGGTGVVSPSCGMGLDAGDTFIRYRTGTWEFQRYAFYDFADNASFVIRTGSLVGRWGGSSVHGVMRRCRPLHRVTL